MDDQHSLKLLRGGELYFVNLFLFLSLSFSLSLSLTLSLSLIIHTFSYISLIVFLVYFFHFNLIYSLPFINCVYSLLLYFNLSPRVQS